MKTGTCAQCGSAIDEDHPHGLCPACLLKEGMEETRMRGLRLRCAACESELANDARFCAQCAAPVPSADGSGIGDPVRKALETKLRGQYRLGRMLGRGGMGAVYLARDLALDREVAIKVIKGADTQQMYDRFRREARTSARLSHPNIVPLHSFGEVEGMPFFVMGYIRGESLADRLRRDGTIAEEESRRILGEIAGALDHAHRQGIVHRDIKPDNVLIEDESGRALLTDFGVAKALGKGETLTRSGAMVGTTHYMSPEQASGRSDIDGRSDIYSLGVMGYAMLSGRLPFDGSTPAEVLTKHLTQEPPPLRSLAEAVSDSTVQAVERCLAKDPAARWQDARALRQALGAGEVIELPDELQAVEGRGPIALAATIFWFLFLLVLERGGMPRAVFVFHAGLIAALYLFVIVSLWRQGFSIAQSHQVIWREPSWWLWWYPRTLRRTRNVWERLPAPVRHLRSWFPVLLLFLGTLFIGEFPNWYASPGAFAFKLGGMLAMGLVWQILGLRASRALRRHGLAAADRRRVLVTVPASRAGFWARPHIAAILTPETGTNAMRRSDSPHDHLQSILRHAEELPGTFRPLGGQAAVAGRQLVESIEQSEKQIAELARNLEPGEEERLAGKIEALDGPAEGEDEYAPLRSLLEKQLELVRGLSERIEVVKKTRNRRVEMLKTLALHVASLKGRLREAPSDAGPLTDNVRALCDEIGAQAMGLDSRIMPPGSGETPTLPTPGNP